MNRVEKINYIYEWCNENFRFQKLVYGWRFDLEKIKALTDEQLDEFINEINNRKEVK